MKKIYFVLLLIVVLSSISLVSAAENVSTSDNLLGVDNVDTLSKNIDAVSNVSPVSNDVVASENSSNDGGSSVNGADDSINQTNSSNNSSSDDDVKEKPVVTKVVTKDVSSTYGTIMNYNVKVLDQFGQPMAGKSVAVTIGKKTVTKVTDDSGMVTFTLNCQAGKYVIKYKVDAISGSNSYNVKNKITMSTLNWGIKGDVSKVSLIKKNMPNNAWVKKAVAATKNGIPLLKFVGGKGKIVFMTAGVHGNELSSQVAAMQMIQYLEKHPIKGTVYIMPFMNPKGTAANVRDYHGIHLNKKANVKGTISYKTVQLIVKFKCKAYGDFHCSKPGGKLGCDVAMGTYKPTLKSATLAKYIAKHSKVKYIIYKKAGAEYPGALEDVVSLKHIPAVTCEVKTPHGAIVKGSVPKSLSMMKSFLKFNSLI